MSFKSGAQGINSSGKTKGKNLGDTGPSVGIQSAKAVGRNLAKVANQKRG